MTLTTLVTHVEPGEAASLDATLAMPFALTEAWSAHLTTLVFTTDTLAAADEAQAAAHVREAAERRGVSCEIRSRSSFAHGIGEVLVDHLRVADLGVLALRGGAGVGHRMMLGAAIFESGRPVLLAPHGGMPAAEFGRVVVAWDASAAAVRAIHGALPFIRRAAETLVVTVTEEKDFRPDQSGVEVTRLLARHGAKARFVAVPRDGGSVSEALYAAARGAEADLLVMGAQRHSPLHNMVFGSATRELLSGGPSLPTLVAA
ncbi:universal stress protein [Sabulicella glaciei]|uniref:Universal stress protein n=1 Tax=Sabulicella glaciei TaxID=2984948 RepID=A0ABT3NWU2_9PROT|nr:universal stress protein [Roseococcus sp. MDT2-1-1]MCW8086639.1 universal stress protein [Roseococcus sp. MDT2-1-1]